MQYKAQFVFSHRCSRSKNWPLILIDRRDSITETASELNICNGIQLITITLVTVRCANAGCHSFWPTSTKIKIVSAVFFLDRGSRDGSVSEENRHGRWELGNIPETK